MNKKRNLDGHGTRSRAERDGEGPEAGLGGQHLFLRSTAAWNVSPEILFSRLTRKLPNRNWRSIPGADTAGESRAKLGEKLPAILGL